MAHVIDTRSDQSRLNTKFFCKHFHCYYKNNILTPGARFNKEVQPTLSLNFNSELSYSEMGNSEFSVTEQLNCVSLLNSM